MRSPVIALLFAALVCACKPSGTCEADVQALDAMVQAIPLGNYGFSLRTPPESIALLDDAVPATDVVSPEHPIFYVFPVGIATKDRTFIADTSVAEAARDLEPLVDPADGRRMVLVVQLDTPWRMVQTALEAARARGLQSIDLLFRRSTPIPPAPAPSFALDLEPEQASSRRMEAANGLGKVAERCPQLAELIESIALLPEAEFVAALRSGVAGTLRACECRADPPTLGALVHYLIAPPFHPAVVTVPLPADPGDATLQLPANAPWSEVHLRVVETRERPTRFAAG